MDQTGVMKRVGHIAAVGADLGADAAAIKSGLVAIRESRAWLDSQQAGLVRMLRLIDSFPEATIADAGRESVGAAAKTTERSATLDHTPTLSGALNDGAITAAHIDAVTRASRKLDAHKRGDLFDRADTLAAVAKAGTVDEFARRIEAEARRLQDDDGMDRLERQRRNARVRSWVDVDGMWNLSAKFDPLTGARIAARIDAMVDALFGEQAPVECPEDPIEKQRYLAARATAQLLLDEAINGHEAEGDPGPPTTRPRPGRPEFVAVIDADAPGHHGPIAEFSIPIEIPASVLADLAINADVHAVVVRNGVVLYAPGELNLGRTTRLASRAQRRALRGLYRSCSIPGCTVAYDRCKLHHIIWWRNDGTTDLDNLVPICSKHHAKIHNDNWNIEIGSHRELTLRLPDGTIHTTGPPSRRRPAA